MRVIAAVAVVLLLSGCVPTSPDASPTPSPTPAPVFASEEEALAAAEEAEEAYAAYLAVSDAIAQDGGLEPERLSDLVTGEWLEKEKEVFEAFAASGRRLVGSTTFSISQLQQLIDPVDGGAELVVYFCTDFSGTSILDASGVDVTPTDRESRVTIEAKFVSKEAGSSDLLLEESGPWVGSSVC